MNQYRHTEIDSFELLLEPKAKNPCCLTESPLFLAQHEAYHSLRGIRTSLEELSLHLNKTMRDFIEEGHEKVGLLRTEDVAPALKIVTDYR